LKQQNTTAPYLAATIEIWPAIRNPYNRNRKQFQN